ncbi:MAG: NPCBM/NEW2 domain-containing protein [Planctomycetes bacterium]|nr:NPCBM/NEW2 domain-containing protein [Planctomycetota bacterium]
MLAAASAILIMTGLAAPFVIKWLLYRSCLERLDKLEAGLHQLGPLPDALGPARRSLEATVRYHRYTLPRYFSSWRAWLFRRARALIAASERDLDGLSRGGDPFSGRRGIFLQVYSSSLDGGEEPFFLDVPYAYDAARSWPLVVQLHGLVGFGEPFQQAVPAHREDCLTLAPHGKGSIDFKWVAEAEVLQAIQEVRARYSVDPRRISLQGHSMGATGAWSLAAHYPHLFQALSASAGNTDHEVWEALWETPEMPEESHLAALRRYLENADSAITYAPNFLNLPVYCVHGTGDETVPVEHSRRMVQKLQEQGCPVTYREVRLASHASELLTSTSDQFGWLMSRPASRAPRNVRLKASSLRHGRSHWVEIRRFERLLQFAEIEANVPEPDLVTVTTRNVAQFALDREPEWMPAGALRLQINGRPEMLIQPEDWIGQTLRLGQNGGQWSILGATEEGLAKRRGLEGPIEDAFMARFLVVYGTAGPDGIEKTVLRREAEALRDQWVLRFGYPCPLKPDTEVTEADVRAANLVCYGRPDQNRVVERAAGKLPVRFEPGRILLAGKAWSGDGVGVKLCTPNPLQPDRYLVVFASQTWRGMFQMNNRFGNWFDWSAYENRNFFDYAVFDERSDLPETFLTFGYFDADWRLSPLYRFDGLPALREKSATWATPSLLEVTSGEQPSLLLSDLLPVRVSQVLGAARFNRSFQGHPLAIADQVFEHGFGVRAPSTLEFDLAGRFQHFSAWVGIDADGQTVSANHRTHNRLIFEVFGDGKRLASSGILEWGGAPERLTCSLSGVRRLALSVRQESGYRWFLLSAAWGEPTLLR